MSFAALSLTVLSMLSRAASVASTNCPNEPVAAAWYTDILPLSSVSWDKYNTLIYSFATTTPTVDSLSLDDSNSTFLLQFVSQAHEHGVSAHVSIGGWYGSRFFSSDLATPGNRTAFVKTVADFASQYGLDGVNFDWEYPNRQGVGCNTINANDTENLLAFLRELRADSVGSQLTLSAATSITPFNDASGKPSTDMSGFADVLDYIAIMNYDVWGSWSADVGPNAPLNDTCAAPANQVGSAVSAVKAWTAAGMPIEKIVLGVAAYGHSFSVSPSDAFVSDSIVDLVPYPPFDKSKQPLGDSQSSTGGINVCGVMEGPGGTFNFWGLIDGGFLDQDGNPAPGIHYRYDACSQTPYVYNKTSQVMISFDNVESYAAKGNYIKETGLKGFSMWQAAGDYNNLLIDSIRSAAGFDS